MAIVDQNGKKYNDLGEALGFDQLDKILEVSNSPKRKPQSIMDLTATTEDGHKMPFRTWFNGWVQENIDGHYIARRKSS